MFMPKSPVSVTLDTDNLVWLRGRAASQKRRSLSEALDDIVTAARTGGLGTADSRSVVGTVDIAESDPGLDQADAYVRTELDASLSRPLAVHEEPATYGVRPAVKRPEARMAKGRRARA
jgi:hypothetical protein